MNQRPPLLIVLVDASHRQESADKRAGLAIGSDATFPAGNAGPHVVAMGGNGSSACVLVRSADLDAIDAHLEAWMQATATRFADAQQRYHRLTPRERQVLPLLTDGLLNKQAASMLGISEATLQIHRGRIMRKMGARTFAELVRVADVLGLSSANSGTDDGCTKRVGGGSEM